MTGFIKRLLNRSHKLADVRTLKQLCNLAESHARKMGQTKPGAEHFVLAALELPDQLASQALQGKGVTPASYTEAIINHYQQALLSQGINVGDSLSTNSPLAQSDPTGLYHTQRSGQQLMQHLAKLPKDSALNSVHVLQAVSQLPDSVAMRALQSFHLSPDTLNSLNAHA